MKNIKNIKFRFLAHIFFLGVFCFWQINKSMHEEVSQNLSGWNEIYHASKRFSSQVENEQDEKLKQSAEKLNTFFSDDPSVGSDSLDTIISIEDLEEFAELFYKNYLKNNEANNNEANNNEANDENKEIIISKLKCLFMEKLLANEEKYISQYINVINDMTNKIDAEYLDNLSGKK